MFCKKRNIIPVAALMLVSACGFEPLYVEKKSSGQWYYDNKFDTGIKEEMASVKVELIQDRIGQLIRKDLHDKLSHKAEPKQGIYILKDTINNKQKKNQNMTGGGGAGRALTSRKLTRLCAMILRLPAKRLFTK